MHACVFYYVCNACNAVLVSELSDDDFQPPSHSVRHRLRRKLLTRQAAKVQADSSEKSAEVVPGSRPSQQPTVQVESVSLAEQSPQVTQVADQPQLSAHDVHANLSTLTSSTLTDGFAKLTCSACGKLFKSDSALRRHIYKIHPAVEGATFLAMTSRKKRHVKKRSMHTEKCSLCDKLFVNKNGVRKHLKRAHSVAAVAVKQACPGKQLL